MRLPFRKVCSGVVFSILLFLDRSAGGQRCIFEFHALVLLLTGGPNNEIMKMLHSTVNPNASPPSDMLNVRSGRLDRGCPRSQGYQAHARVS